MKQRKLKPIVIKSRRGIIDYRLWKSMNTRLCNGIDATMCYECVSATPLEVFAIVYEHRGMIPLEWWGTVVSYTLHRTGRGTTPIAELIKAFIRNSR